MLTPEMQAKVDRVVERTSAVSVRNDGMIFDMFYSSEMYEEITETAPYPQDPFLLEDLIADKWIKEWSIE